MTTKHRKSAANRRYALRRKLYSYRQQMNSTSVHSPHGPATITPPMAASDATELTQLREALLRQRAEFDNFRKRSHREKEMIREAAAEGILSKLLPIIDNMDRAISSAESAADIKSVRDGVSMIVTQLHRMLEMEGLQKVDALHQRFDPTMHDALVTEERSDIAENHITEVLMHGYIYKEKLLRAAMVKVARLPAGEKAPITE